MVFIVNFINYKYFFNELFFLYRIKWMLFNIVFTVHYCIVNY